jgi:hypothetical protein
MTVSARSSGVGRRVFGASTLGSPRWSGTTRDQRRRRIAVSPVGKSRVSLFGAVYLVFTLLCLPRIVAAPLTYDRWGNLFEQLSMLTGAIMIYARSSSAWPPAATGRVGRILLGLCTVSFTLEQAIYLQATTAFVPKWLPPGPMFRAIATTVLFALAAMALLMNRRALLAARLVALMILIFGLLVWVPALVSNPDSHNSWSETAETFAIVGAMWILAELLDEDSCDRTASGMTQ